MQTFLPLANFYETSRCLDYKRLGKMRVESMQIINIIEGKSKSKAWKNHPCVLMWKDYLNCLKVYHDEIIKEWIRRGYNNTMKLFNLPLDADVYFPRWFGNEDFHSRHRAALLAKNPEWYGQFGWKEKPVIDYRWE